MADAAVSNTAEGNLVGSNPTSGTKNDANQAARTVRRSPILRRLKPSTTRVTRRQGPLPF